MIGVPLLILGLLLVLSAFTGAWVSGERRGLVASFFLSPLDPAAWHATVAILLGFWFEILAFALVFGFFASGASTFFGGIGIVLIGVGVEIARRVARRERRRFAWVDPRPLRPHAYRDPRGGLRELLTAAFFDVNRWRDVAYVFVSFPLIVLEFSAVLALWIAALVGLSTPAWYLLDALPAEVAQLPISPELLAVVAGLAGIVLVFVAAASARGLMTLHRAVVSGFLCTSEQEVLERRVETLEVSRKKVLDVEASELRRIERDLHDGAQQRLVLLTMNLSMAAEKIDSDPVAAKGLVTDARDQARFALAEIRDLVRGIAPAILMDRGLVSALSALASRTPIPTTVVSSLPDETRLSDATERAAYFVVAEALANVAKHSAAKRCEIRCRLEGGPGGDPGAGGLLVVEIWDDGAGGAKIIPGSGLAGLVGRVEALDGRLSVSSPDGGPTLIRAELPAQTAGMPAAVRGTAGGTTMGRPLSDDPELAGAVNRVRTEVAGLFGGPAVVGPVPGWAPPDETQVRPGADPGATSGGSEGQEPR